jgi:membrane peptidoglycan carboxypeptidase
MSSKEKNKKGLAIILKFLGLAAATSVLAALFMFLMFARDLPRPEKFTEKQLSQSTKIYDKTGQVLLYEIYGEEKRTVMPLSHFSDYLKQAIVATEDANFYHHFGIDVKRFIFSLLTDLKIGRLSFGGSTIDQQLIRSTFLTTEKTAVRKTREIILSLELDRRYSKDQILEWYINQVPFGQNTYGAEAASQTYFKKSASELSLAQTAALVALIKGPSYYSPYGNHKKELLARKDYVLDMMVSTSYITKEEAETAKKETLEFATVLNPIKAPHFTLWVQDYLANKYGEDFLRQEGLKVYTSLDWNLQKAAEDIVLKWSKTNQSSNANNEALVAINPKTGEILAMVGSANWYATSSYPQGCLPGDCLFDPKFNVTVGSAENPGRQPGSSFKPFVYVTAFENGFNDLTTLADIQTNFGIWGGEVYTPQNYDGNFRGDVTLRNALAQSLNIPSIKVLYLVGGGNLENANTTDFTGQESIYFKGVSDSIETAKKMGITTLNQPLSSYGPAIVLGGGEVTLLDMTSAYGVFATEGNRVSPVSILKITDSQGNIIEENNKTPQRVLPIEPTRLINDILSDNNARAPIFGTNSSLYFPDWQVAVKTGTTQDYHDAWVIGYTPSIVVGAWAGNSNNSPINRKTGAMIAAPFWHEFMLKALPLYPHETFQKPQTTTSQDVSPSSL